MVRGQLRIVRGGQAPPPWRCRRSPDAPGLQEADALNAPLRPAGAAGTGYVHDTYGKYVSGSERSAAIVAGMLVPLLQPNSVLDVGCGTGGWAEAFRARGVAEVHGIDGEWSPAGKRLRSGEFTSWNFQRDDPAGPALPRERYDLEIGRAHG